METISKSPSTSLPVYIGDDTTDEDALRLSPRLMVWYPGGERGAFRFRRPAFGDIR